METSAFKAEIFIPETGFDWRLNSRRLIYVSFFLMPIFYCLIFLINVDPDLKKVVFSMLLLFIIIGSSWGYSEKQKKFGKIEGILIINDKFVSIGENKYSWEDISNFSFNLFQVLDEPLYNEFLPYTRLYGGPAFSAGVDNYLDFNYNNDHHLVYFRLETPSHKVELMNVLKKQFFLGHIELHKTYDGLHLEYEQIQQLKQQKLEFRKGKAHNSTYE